MKTGSIAAIKGVKVVLYGPTADGTKLLAEYSQEGALTIGYQLIEAAMKLRYKLRRGGSPSKRNPCQHCGQATPRGNVYCSQTCRTAHRSQRRQSPA